VEALDESTLVAALLGLTIAMLAIALIATVATLWRSRACVGRARVAERASAIVRGALVAVPVVLGVFVVLQRDAATLPAMLAVLAESALICALRPASGDSIYGERGVRSGWHARTFERLEEWRLAGEHLRWRLGSEWFACRVPVEMQPELRAKLLALAPERESRFNC
jgi:hypothetical protein